MGALITNSCIKCGKSQTRIYQCDCGVGIFEVVECTACGHWEKFGEWQALRPVEQQLKLRIKRLLCVNEKLRVRLKADSGICKNCAWPEKAIRLKRENDELRRRIFMRVCPVCGQDLQVHGEGYFCIDTACEFSCSLAAGVYLHRLEEQLNIFKKAARALVAATDDELLLNGQELFASLEQALKIF